MRKPLFCGKPSWLFRPLFWGIPLLGLCLGCKTLAPPEPPPPPVPLLEDPRAVLGFEKAEAQSINRVSLHFILKIENPRPAGLQVAAEVRRLGLNGVDVREGAKVSWGTMTVAPVSGGHSAAGPARAEFPVLIELDFDELLKAGLPDPDDCEAALALDLAFTFDSDPVVRLPVLGTAVFPRIREPVFSITAIAVRKAELINTRFLLTVRIDNPNAFPLELSTLAYELYGGGRFWAEGAEKNILRIPPRSSAERRLSLVMNFINMKRDLLDQIIAMTSIRYRFKGAALADTGIGYLPRFRTEFNLEGLSEVVD